MFFVVMGVVAISGVYLAVVGIRDANEPRYWGTFTEESCIEPNHRGWCTSVGTWISDDGSIQLEGVYLDGFVGDDGTVAAQYQPAEIGNDVDERIVHTSFGVAVGPFAPIVLFAFAGGFSFFYWRKWRGSWGRGKAW